MADLTRPELPLSSAAIAEPTRHDPDSGGHFGVYGGRYVAEALMAVIEEVTAASRVGYCALPVAQMRELMKDPSVNLQILAVLAESRWRTDRLAISIGRLDAQARICVMLLDLYERLRHRGLISRLSSVLSSGLISGPERSAADRPGCPGSRNSGYRSAG